MPCAQLYATESQRSNALPFTESCCCNHGGRCSCSFKNDLDTVPETAGLASEADGEEELSSSASTARGGASSTSRNGTSGGSPSGRSPIRRRRANTTRSEGTLNFDNNSRHKTVSQKHAKAAAQKTSPYPISRINSARSTGSLSTFLMAAGRGSVEDEDLEDSYSNGNAGSDSGAEEIDASSLAAAAAAAASSNCGTFRRPGQLTQQRRSRSETASPLLFANSFPQVHQLGGNNQLAPLNMGMLSYNTYTNYNAFSPEPVDQPLFSAGLSAPSVDWSQIGLDFDRGFNTGSDNKLSTTEPFGFSKNFAYDFNGSEQAPTMTTGTSGEVSEVEELVPGLDDFDYEYDLDNNTDAASGSIAFSRASSTYHLSNAAVSVRNDSSNDVNELRFLKAGNKFLPTPQAATSDELAGLSTTTRVLQAPAGDDDEAALWMNDYNSLPTMTESPESDVISFWGTK